MTSSGARQGVAAESLHESFSVVSADLFLALFVALDAGPLPLSEVLARFEREASPASMTRDAIACPISRGPGPPSSSFTASPTPADPFSRPSPAVGALPLHRLRPAGRSGDGARLWRYRHECLVADLCSLLDHLKIERAYLLGAPSGRRWRCPRCEPTSRLPRAHPPGRNGASALAAGGVLAVLAGRCLPGTTKRIPKRERSSKRFTRRRSPRNPRKSGEPSSTGLDGSAGDAGPSGAVAAPPRPAGNSAHVTQPVLLVWGDRDRVMPLLHAIPCVRPPTAGLAIIEGLATCPATRTPTRWPKWFGAS